MKRSLVLSEMSALGRTKDFRVVSKLYNNCLRERRERLGLTHRALAEAAGVPWSIYMSLETLRRSPLVRIKMAHGRLKWSEEPCAWSKTALALAAFYDVSPAELFPDAINDVQQVESERTFDATDVPWLAGVAPQALPSPEDLVAAKEIAESIPECLSVREEEILAARLRGDNLAEIGETFKRSSETIRKVESSALRKLRARATWIKGETVHPPTVLPWWRR